jgi:predicted NUDIX family NTP pyrophosphohydrolase
MAVPQSAALVVNRRPPGSVEFLLAHPGGPFWARRDDGAWTFPKGLIEPGEAPLAAALREFAEETGCPVSGDPVALSPARQPSRKLILPFLLEADPDLSAFQSNIFEMEWPPRSGRTQAFPEIDRIAWFRADEALRKLLAGQRPIVAEALAVLGRA